jgi:hypothetical protein
VQGVRRHPRREIFGVLGPNAQDHLLRMLRFCPPGLGHHRRHDVATEPDRVKARIGTCPNASTLWHPTTAENCALRRAYGLDHGLEERLVWARQRMRLRT